MLSTASEPVPIAVCEDADGDGVCDGQSVGPNEILLVPGVMDVGEYGFGWGSGIHQGGLVATFDSTGEALTFRGTGYDIDSNTEVRVLLNGEELGYLSAGADNGLNGGDTFLLQAQAQKVGLNEIQFVTKRPNRVWGVTDLLLSAAGNNPPSVSLDFPMPDDTFAAEQDMILEASASDDGSIVSVAFFAGNQKLGEDSTAPYSYAWTGVPAGSYSLTAVATDDQMLSTVRNRSRSWIARTRTATLSVMVSPRPVSSMPPGDYGAEHLAEDQSQ